MDNETRESDVKAAVDAGMRAVNAESRMVLVRVADRDGGPGVPVAILPQGMRAEVLTVAMKEAERREPAPARIKGLSEHLELDSFIRHVNEFKLPKSAAWANPDKRTITAIFNYHERGKPAWGDHRAVYTCPLSAEWQRWVLKDSANFSQDKFADFLEENFDDLAPPPKDADGAKPVELIELSRNLAIHTNGTFARKVDPVTGEHAMVCKQEHSESSTKIPKRFFLALSVFEGGAKYRVEARIRFRMREGRPQFSFIPHRADAIFRDAFGDVRKEVEVKTSLPVFVGTPEE